MEWRSMCTSGASMRAAITSDIPVILTEKIAFSKIDTHARTHAHTHTPLTARFSRTTWVSRYQKGKPIWILLKQETVISTACQTPFAPPPSQRDLLGPDLQNILRQSYDNAKVTIDVRQTSHSQNIQRRTQGFSQVQFTCKIVKSSEIVFVH